VGTAFLLMAVVGSGIMAERLSSDIGVQLLMNSIATCAPLAALILMFARVSGAHFNPAVTITALLLRQIDPMRASLYVVVQIIGAIAGVIVANLMFALPWINVSEKTRDGGGLLLGEIGRAIGRWLDHRRVHLYLKHQLREPCRHARSNTLRHLCRYRTVVGTGIYRDAAPGDRDCRAAHQALVQ